MLTPIRAGMLAIMALLVSGCAYNLSSFWEDAPEQPPEEMPKQTADNGLRYRPELRDKLPPEVDTTSAAEVYLTPRNVYQPSYTHKALNDYAEQLTMKLMDNARSIDGDSLVGVASFVRLDESLRQTSILGNQLSEYMMTELQHYGVSVVDFKMANAVLVTRYGDYVFSRDAVALAKSLKMDYVLAGTIVQDERGVRVNARVVDMKSKVVVTAASLEIPQFMLTALVPVTRPIE